MFLQAGRAGSSWVAWALHTGSLLLAPEPELGVQDPVGYGDPAGLTAGGSGENFQRRRRTELERGRANSLVTMGTHRPGVYRAARLRPPA